MAEINYFYIDMQGNQQGPRSIEQLKNAQVIYPDTMVWSQGMNEWCKASDVIELAELFTQAPDLKYEKNTTDVDVKPRTWLIETILATLFCCFAFGIAGIIFASKVDDLWKDGKYEQARAASSTARLMLILSVASVFLLILIYVLFFSFISTALFM